MTGKLLYMKSAKQHNYIKNILFEIIYNYGKDSYYGRIKICD